MADHFRQPNADEDAAAGGECGGENRVGSSRARGDRLASLNDAKDMGVTVDAHPPVTREWRGYPLET